MQKLLVLKKILNYYLVSFLCLGVLFTGGCATIQTKETSQMETIDISNVSGQEDISALEKMANGEEIEEPVIFLLPKGFKLPVFFELDTPVVTMESEGGKLVFERDVYLYLSTAEVLLSPDKDRWAPMGNMKLIKELFGAGQGEIVLNMGASKETGSLLEVQVVLRPTD